ncbi:MAG: XTP/dITP diphosphatase [Lentisphaerae bacterium]|nr:XTP/dITP diphosphatase [Lentisphaerota bacterium]
MKLLIATGNQNKLREVRQILAAPGVDLVGQDSIGGNWEVIEDGATFEANAVKKAATLAKATGYWTLADDSGLCVDVLGGAPGVLSARYAGEPVDCAANNRKLLAELGSTRNRTARFICVLAIADPSGKCVVIEGECRGRITNEPRGKGGFGYDPLFIPDGYKSTFGEMTSAEKNAISHRAIALARAREKLERLIKRTGP